MFEDGEIVVDARLSARSDAESSLDRVRLIFLDGVCPIVGDAIKAGVDDGGTRRQKDQVRGWVDETDGLPTARAGPVYPVAWGIYSLSVKRVAGATCSG